MATWVDVGIDCGTKVTKAVAVDDDGAVLTCAVRPTRWDVPAPGRGERDVATLLADVDALLAEVAAAVARAAIRSVGVCSIAESGVLLAPDGSVRNRMMAWHDVRGAAQAAALARRLVDRPGFRLVGMMSYEAQIAGVGDLPPGRALRSRAIQAVQQMSQPELLRRRGAAVEAVRRHADLEFVNGGGTGSVAATSADPAVTEVTAGSGLYGPTLFDAYRSWRPTPAAFFALSVVRRPAPQRRSFAPAL